MNTTINLPDALRTSGSSEAELVSALMDGQLAATDCEHALDAACALDGRRAWETYHLIGDVLRSADLAAATPCSAFMQRLSSKLAQEQAPAATGSASASPRVVDTPRVSIPRVPTPRVSRPGTAAANDASFRWKLVAGFATLTAAAAIAWTALGPVRPPAGAVLAGAPAASGGASAQAGTAFASAERSVMLRDPRLDELLAAHRQVSGHMRLGVPGGGVQNAAFAVPAR